MIGIIRDSPTLSWGRLWMSGPSFMATNSNTVQTFSNNHNSQRHSGAKENVWVPLVSFGNEGLIFEQTFISIYPNFIVYFKMYSVNALHWNMKTVFLNYRHVQFIYCIIMVSEHFEQKKGIDRNCMTWNHLV